MQKIDTNCQTDGVESTKNSMQKTQDSKFAQLTCRNEPSSRAQAQPLKMKTAFNNTKKGRGTGKKRFGIQGNAISKQTKDDDKQGVAAVSVPQVKNSIDDIIDLKIDHEL